MPNSVKKEEVVQVVEQVVETVAPVVEETPVVEVKLSPSFNKEEVVAKLAELASIFRTMYGEQLNPVFAEIHKSLSNAQYKIMQNL
jgi:nucleoid DNA-binding protein